MIRPIVKDIFFLSQVSEPANKSDLSIGKDLKDTLSFHKNECVGMAANMIGFKKNIIIISLGIDSLLMFNPTILSKKHSYETKESCLSLSGERKTIRYKDIIVSYLDTSWKKHIQSFSGFTAQIIQHEIDHLNGKII